MAYCIKIGNVQIGNAQIGNVEIGNAQIGNIKLGNAEIGRMEWPFSATVHMISFGTIHFEDRFCTSKNGGIGRSVWA